MQILVFSVVHFLIQYQQKAVGLILFVCFNFSDILDAVEFVVPV